jgi:predicted TIM-barrel fold metal-dependent hydrolase
VKDWGAVAIKIMPANNIPPDSQACYPVYEVCRALQIPVVIHTGTGDLGCFVEPAHPYHLERPAKDFPDIQFVMAHCGGGMDGLWRNALMMLQFIPNVAVDLAEWQYPIPPSEIDPGREEEFIHTLNILRRNLGSLNIMMGTDYMKGHRAENDSFWIELFKDLPTRAKKFGYTFSEDEADLYRCGNAARIYGI